MNKLFFSFITPLYILGILAQPVWSSSASILNESNLPPEFEATYEIHKSSMRVGKMEVSLKKVGDEVIYQSVTKPVGMAAMFLGDQTSNDRAVLKLINDSYRAAEFTHNIENSDKDRNEHYVFDWDNKKAATTYKGKSNELDILDNTFDNYSAQLLLMREPDSEITSNTYSVISSGRLKEYTYQLEATELVETKLGKFEATKYVRKKDNKKKTSYYGWYAEKLNYLPIKLDKFENGKLDVSIRLTNVKWLNEKSN